MTDNVKVAISSDFLTAFARLPRQVQGKVTEFVNKFRNNPMSPGINYEKLNSGIDKKIFSVRIDDTYRGIVVRQQEAGVYLLLWVDHHDEAYQWAARKRCEVNPKTGAIQVFDVQTVVEQVSAPEKVALFALAKDDDLLRLGVPEVQLDGEKPIVENFENANDEFDFLLREVKKLKENGVSLTDICVVARTKKLVDDYIALFTRAGIRSYAIKRNKVDDRSFDGLRVATMHRVKGLEFKYVFIAAVNNRIIPMPSAINKTDVVSEAESITSEKCLLYVAMTRAQKGVYITSYGRPSEFLG